MSSFWMLVALPGASRDNTLTAVAPAESTNMKLGEFFASASNEMAKTVRIYSLALPNAHNVVINCRGAIALSVLIHN